MPLKTNRASQQGWDVIPSRTDAETLRLSNPMSFVEVRTGGAETRTIADPAYVGQLLVLYMHTDGGDCTITFSTAYDQAGSTTFTLSAVKESGMFYAVNDATNGLTWQTVGDLVTLSLDGTSITSTAAELNILDGVTATAAELNMAADSSANTEVVTTTNVITAAESGKTFILNSATAFVSTLPAVAAGLRFTFIAGATQVTGGNHTIVPNAANDNTIYGEYLVAGATIPASAEGSINWIADTILPGDIVHLFCDGTNWYVSGMAAATGAITFTT